MPTGQKLANIFINRLLSLTAVKDQIVGFLSQKIDETMSALLQGSSGTLDADKVTLTGPSANKVSVNVSLANKVAVGTGQVITIPNGVTQETADVSFENANTVPYYVAVKYAQVEADAALNPRRGTPEYLALLDSFGELGNPDSCVVTGPGTGNNLRLVVNSLTESGVTNAGRIARVWLVTPKSGVDSVAIKEYAVQYSAPNNFIDIPYSISSPPLGQDVSSNPPSTTPSDYKILIKGITVKRNTDLRNLPQYAFIGIITGNAGTPAVFNTDDQKAVFLVTLDKAYDGIGSGSGRVVDVDAGPVEWRLYNGQTLDPSEVGMKLKGNDNTAFWMPESTGRIAEIPRIKDDFLWALTGWNTTAGTPSVYTASVSGAGSVVRIRNQDNSPYFNTACGLVELFSDTAVTTYARLRSGDLRLKNRLPGLYFRFAIRDLHTAEIKLHIYSSNTVAEFGFFIKNALVKGRVVTDAAVTTDTATLKTLSTNELIDAYAVAKNHNTISFWVTGMGAAVDLSFPDSFNSLADNKSTFLMEAQVETVTNTEDQRLVLDYWDFWAKGILPASVTS